MRFRHQKGSLWKYCIKVPYLYLSGGNMMFVGMQDRLYKEVAALAPSAVKIRVIDPPERFLI